MKQLKMWKKIASSMDDQAVVLLYVLESKGSSPGRRGFAMCVTADGIMEGSIGGGIMEHKFVEMAKEKLKSSTSKSASVRKQVHDKKASKDQSGMICSGEQTILVYEVRESDKPAIDSIIAALENDRNGELKLSPSGIQFEKTQPTADFYFAQKSEDDWLYKEKIGYKQKLTIIGGGHCSLAFSRLMQSLDFYITVYDDRPGLKTWEENQYCNEKKILKDYSELTHLVTGGEDHYVVIMTFGYRSDDEVLRALLGKEFKYLGLLGSKKKIEKMFEDYSNEGISKEVLQRIHTPIGLPIKSQTPEEIAVSIAAEIIRVKNRDL